MFFIRVILIISLLSNVVLFVHPLPVTADGPSVVINELFWTGSSASSADEWIELRNMTDQSIDLSNWQLTKKSSGTEAAMLTIPAGKILPASGFFLVSNYAETSTSSMLALTPDVVDTAMSLSNSALQIKLYDATHLLIDTADDGVGNPEVGDLDSANHVYASMERNPIPGDGMQSQNWHTASRGVGFKANAPELGTPGTANSNGIPTAVAGPDQQASVGQVVNFDGSDSTDPEGQALTFAWDFGDGGTSSASAPQHVYSAAGTFTATLVVSDGIDSAQDVTKATITASASSSAPTVTTTPSSSSSDVTNQSCQGLHLSELYPNPPGVDSAEFIELQNSGDEDVVPQGCSLWTSPTKKYVLTAGGTVLKNGFLVLPKSVTKLTLNNGGATIRLVDVNGAELDRATYGSAPEGESYSFIANLWQWTGSSTPGRKNVLTTPVKPSAKTSASSKSTKKVSSKTVPPVQSVSLADVQSLDSGDRVKITGVVTSPVGALGATISTLQSDDGGVTITLPNGIGPLTVGQRVEVTGTVRLYQGRRRVAVETKGLAILSTATIEPQTMATDDVGADQADELVHIHGTVALASGASIEVDDGSGSVTVYLKSSTGIVRPKIKMGDTVDAVGIVAVSTTGIRILPRQQSDLHVEKVLGASIASAPTTSLPTSSTHQTFWYWIFVALGGAAVSIKPLWKKWQERQT